MTQINVKDSTGATVPVELPLAPGQLAAAESKPVTLSSENVAAIGSLTETAPATDTASAGLNGRLQRLAQRITSVIGQLPASLGQKAAAAALAVTQSTEDASQIGSVTETAPATDTANSGLNGRLQRIAQRITTMLTLLPATLGSKAAAASLAVTQSTEDAALIGALSETPPANDTANSGLNGRLQRVAQRLTTLIQLFPASLGAKAASASFPVTQSAEDAALIGAATETAPATDTASSGLNGRLQRVSQRITSLIALQSTLNGLFPTSLGVKAASASLSVTQSTEDAALTGPVTETAPATDTASSGLNGRLQRIAQRTTSLIALLPSSVGRKSMAGSLSVTNADDDALLGSVTETAPATDTASSGLNGRLQRIAQRLTALIALVPGSLGSKAASASFAVTDSTEDVARVGIITETAPATDTASSGLNGRLQRLAQRVTSLMALVGEVQAVPTPNTVLDRLLSVSTATEAIQAAAEDPTAVEVMLDTADPMIGPVNETPPGTDTANGFGLNGRLQRIAQNITTQTEGATYVDTDSIANASGVSQTVAAAMTHRRYLMVHNPSSSVSWWINPTGSPAVAGAAGSFELPPGATWEPQPPPINIVKGIATVNTDLTSVSA